jgi:hypothetical protein
MFSKLFHYVIRRHKQQLIEQENGYHIEVSNSIIITIDYMFYNRFNFISISCKNVSTIISKIKRRRK